MGNSNTHIYIQDLDMEYKALHVNRNGTSVLPHVHHYGNMIMIKYLRWETGETPNRVSGCPKATWALQKHVAWLHKAGPSQEPCRSDTTICQFLYRLCSHRHHSATDKEYKCAPQMCQPVETWCKNCASPGDVRFRRCPHPRQAAFTDRSSHWSTSYW